MSTASWPWPLSAVEGFFKSVFNQVLFLLEQARNTVVTWAFWIRDRITDAIVSIGGSVFGVFNLIASRISTAVFDIVSQARGIVGLAESSLRNAFSFVRTEILGRIDWVRDQVSLGLASVHLLVRTGVENASAALIDNVNALSGTLQTQLNLGLAQVNQSLGTVRDQAFGVLVEIGRREVELGNIVQTGAEDLGREFQTAFDGAVNAVGGALGSFPGQLVTVFRDQLGPAIVGGFQWLWDRIRDLINFVTSSFYQGVQALSPANPEGALSRSLIFMVQGMTTLNAFWSVATAAELIHPLKQIGLLRIVDFVTRMSGADVLGGVVGGAVFGAAISTPLRFEMNALFRPTQFDPRTAFSAWSQGHLTEAQLKKFYAFAGFRDELHDGLTDVLDRDPNARDLQLIFEDTIPDREWVLRKLRAQGYRGEDPDRLLGGLEIRAKRIERSMNVSNMINLFAEGFMDYDPLRSELTQLGFREDQVALLLKAATWREFLDRRKDQVSAVREAFLKDAISDQEMRRELLGLELRDERIEALIRIDTFRKKQRKREDTKRPLKRLTEADMLRAWREGLIDEPRIRRWLEDQGYLEFEINILVELNRPTPPPPLKPVALPRAELLELFRLGIIDEEVLRSELKRRGFTDRDIALTVRAELVKIQRPAVEKIPTLSVGELKRSFRAGVLFEDELRAELAARGFSTSDIEVLVSTEKVFLAKSQAELTTI